MTKTKLNIESWNRKEHFRFFSAFDDPFFGITTNVDFTTIYLEAKRNSHLFSFTRSIIYRQKPMKQTNSN